jgi:hypothetical protein
MNKIFFISVLLFSFSSQAEWGGISRRAWEDISANLSDQYERFETARGNRSIPDGRTDDGGGTGSITYRGSFDESTRKGDPETKHFFKYPKGDCYPFKAAYDYSIKAVDKKFCEKYRSNYRMIKTPLLGVECRVVKERIVSEVVDKKFCGPVFKIGDKGQMQCFPGEAEFEFQKPIADKFCFMRNKGFTKPKNVAKESERPKEESITIDDSNRGIKPKIDEDNGVVDTARTISK